MSNEPILLFLHGVGDGDHGDKWRTRLAETLTGLGYPDLDESRVIAPKYAHALKGWDYDVPLPGLTIRPLARDAARQNRRDFERRMGAIEFRLGRHDGGFGYPGAEAAISAAARVPKMKQAWNYLHEPRIRAQVLDLILSKLPASGRIVIVGHSLGSVIAADLVCRLPVGLDVAGMVTIGSPLGSLAFNVDKLRDSLKEPPTNLAWWVNVWNAPDPVAAHRGISRVFPWMVDFRVDTKSILQQAHLAIEYFANDAVAASIGFALFGSQSKELVGIEKGLDIPLDGAEHAALITLRYSHLLKARLDGEKRDRFAGALRQVQANVVGEIKRRNASENRALPSAIARSICLIRMPQFPSLGPHPIFRRTTPLYF